MKWNTSTVAIVLSVLAIIISSAQPTYNFLVAQNMLRKGKPSFDVSTGVSNGYTGVVINNNGTSKAHNIEVSLTFIHIMRIWPGGSHPTRVANEFVPELREDNSVTLTFPIGRKDLMQDLNLVYKPENTHFYNTHLFDGWARYDIEVDVTCNELEETRHFSFDFEFLYAHVTS